MILFVDTATNQFVSDSLHKVPLDSVSFKRGDAASIELRFVEGTSVVPLESGASIVFGCKESGKYDGDFLVFTDEYTSVGDAYLIAPSFNTEALDDALNSNGDDSDDLPSISTMLEVSWSEDGGASWQSTDTITATINNDLYKGVEGTPLELASPDEWLAERVIPFSPDLVGLTGGGSTKLDGIPTVGVEVGRIQALLNGDKLMLYQLLSGTESEVPPLTVRPDDYNFSTNAKYWALLALEGSALYATDVATKFLNVRSVDYAAYVSSDFLTTDRYFQFPEADGQFVVADGSPYASDGAAASGGIAVGEIYFNSTSGRFKTRMA